MGIIFSRSGSGHEADGHKSHQDRFPVLALVSCSVLPYNYCVALQSSSSTVPGWWCVESVDMVIIYRQMPRLGSALMQHEHFTSLVHETVRLLCATIVLVAVSIISLICCDKAAKNYRKYDY